MPTLKIAATNSFGALTSNRHHRICQFIVEIWKAHQCTNRQLMNRTLAGGWSMSFLECILESIEKTTREEQGGVYVGMWATPTYTGPPLEVDLFSVDSFL